MDIHYNLQSKKKPMRVCMIKQRLAILFLIVLAGGCTSQRLPMDVPEDNIPEDAEIAVVTAGMQSDALFDVVVDSLKRGGYMIDQNNRKLQAITTQSRNIDDETQMRMSFLIEPINQTSARITVRAEWRINKKEKQENMEEVDNPEAIGWRVASWSDPHPSQRAFAHMVQFIHRLPNDRISFN